MACLTTEQNIAQAGLKDIQRSILHLYWLRASFMLRGATEHSLVHQKDMLRCGKYADTGNEARAVAVCAAQAVTRCRPSQMSNDFPCQLIATCHQFIV